MLRYVCDIKEFLTEKQKRCVVVWGAGPEGDDCLRHLRGLAIETSFFIDPNPGLAFVFSGDKQIYPPAILKSFNPQDVFVFVASRRFAEIAAALNDIGYREGEDFLDSLMLARIRQMRLGEKAAKDYAARYAPDKMPLFNKLEIETINRCNGECSFCPVNRHDEPRALARMSEELFYSIIEQLKELNYAGNIQLFSNNEPFMDKRIISFLRHAREALPRAFLQMMSNGTLLSLEKFNECIDVLDSLIIDNYSDDYEFHPQVRDIYQYCLKHPALQKKVRICKRTPHEVLHSRGGQSPNHPQVAVAGGSCVYPFNQMVVRPGGEISLCCNDALGEVTLGDLKKQPIDEVWNGPEYVEIRKKILQGRQYIKQCAGCTNFFPFFVPPGRHVGEYIPDGPLLTVGKLKVKAELPSDNTAKR
jgi:radical SAM protein with 4Fe4S-binding SPASM domain